MGKKYYWLKLKDDFFTQPKIKKLRRIAGGDTYTIIYLKMQLLSLKNEGRLLWEGTEDNFVDEIALCIDEDPENVGVTVNYLLRQGLLEQASETEFSLPQAMQSIGSETSGAERVRRFRERHKTLEIGTGPEQTGQKVLHCNADVTSCNTEIERRDRERDREKREEIEGEGTTADEPPAPPRPPVPYEAIKDFYNLTCSSFPRCTTMSESRKKAIKARFTSGYTLEDFKKVFVKAEGSSFLKGRNDRNWTATFDWMIKDRNMAKILEGNYDDHDMGPGPGPRPAGGGRNNTGFQTSNPFLEMLREERDKQ